jgi:Flp pilus assembly protein protease CpaA
MTMAFAVIALAVALTAAAIDLRTRTIPNGLTWSIFACGVAAHAWLGHVPGAAAALLCAGLCALPFLPAVLAGGMGGGDLKLALALGALLADLDESVTLLVATVLAGATMALVTAAKQGRLRETLRRVFSRQARRAPGVTIAYGPAFVFGAAAVLLRLWL